MEGKYVLTFKGLTKEGVFDHIATVSSTDLPDRCIQAIALHAAKNEYHQDYSVRGYAACKLLLDGRQESSGPFLPTWMMVIGTIGA